MDAYINTGGSIGEIMDHIPHSTHDDEPRFIILISDLISKGAVPTLPTWESSVKDEKSRLVRQKQGQKEAKEAEKLARELGVWDEFYGSGKTTEKKGRGKGKNKEPEGEEGEVEHSALQALILKKRKNMDGFFDGLAAKYSQPQSTSKPNGGRGKKKPEADSSQWETPEASSNKKSRREAPSPPDIDDDEFEKLQQKLFGNKLDDASVSEPKTTKTGRSRRVK
jgi:DnaJ homolog subfamily C member 9